TMIHLLLALKPEYIRLEPYTPTVLETPSLKAKEAGIEINPEAEIYFSPHIGSYVGGDITAGLLCTDLSIDTDEVQLFIDIGTNGELVLGNRDYLLACACSAGPAFEGGGLECGMRASEGAIEGAEINPETGAARYWTIGDAPPLGICGSGMISLLANLFLTGWIDCSGKLSRTRESPSIKIEGRQARYIIASAEMSGTGRPITVSEVDMENIIRAKAAIYTACSLLLQQVGQRFADLSRIYLAGGFGRFLNLEKAITIGLIPDLPREKFHYLGNSSLTGSYMLLVSERHRERQRELARRITYLELNTDHRYMEQYTAALFLPHTNAELFPSTRK
ncbi:MAG: ASKHA domain-containing protein, partial [Candidatus Uhrbacteria bacterium]